MEKIVPSDDQVWLLYRGRCVVCRMLGNHIHEIIPRSQTKDWAVWDNRVILCLRHHNHVHEKGALNCATFLKDRQRVVLESFYGKNFSDRIARIFDQLR